MSHMRHFILFLLFCILIAAVNQTASGVPASSFTLENGDWYDNFGINRNYYAGPDGFLPNLAYETLGENKELAYREITTQVPMGSCPTLRMKRSAKIKNLLIASVKDFKTTM